MAFLTWVQVLKYILYNYRHFGKAQYLLFLLSIAPINFHRLTLSFKGCPGRVSILIRSVTNKSEDFNVYLG